MFLLGHHESEKVVPGGDVATRKVLEPYGFCLAPYVLHPPAEPDVS